MAGYCHSSVRSTCGSPVSGGSLKTIALSRPSSKRSDKAGTGLLQTSQSSPQRRSRRAPPKTLAPVHPNQGIAAAFRRRLWTLIDEMQASVVAAVTAQYPGGNGLAQDTPNDVHR